MTNYSWVFDRGQAPHHSDHARRRSAQRAVSVEAERAALAWGQRHPQRGGRTLHYLGRRAVQEARRQGEDVAPFEGTCVIVAGDGVVVTVLKTPDLRRALRLGEDARNHRRSQRRGGEG